jgi:hypothetical protein
MPKHNTRFVVWFDQLVSGVTPIVAVRPVEDYDGVALHLLTGADVDGAWLFEASNNYDANGSGAAGDFIDVTALFTFTETGGASGSGNKTVAHGTAALRNQIATSPTRIDWKVLRVTFTPTAGATRCACIFGGKGAE